MQRYQLRRTRPDHRSEHELGKLFRIPLDFLLDCAALACASGLPAVLPFRRNNNRRAWHRIRPHVPFWDQRTVSIIRTLAVFAAIAFVIFEARHTIITLIFAIFFAYLIDPIVTRVERWPRVSRGSRGLAIAEVYVIVSIVLAIIAFSVGSKIVSEGRHLVSSAPALLDQSTWSKIIYQISSKRGWSYQTQFRIEHLVMQHRGEIVSAVLQAAQRIKSLLSNSFWLALIPLLAIFFLKSGQEFAQSGVRLLRLQPRSRIFLEAALRDINDMAAHYIRAQVLLAGFALVAYTVVLVSARVQDAVFLGLAAGALEFIPLLGPLVAATCILGVAFLTGFHHVWLLVLFLGAWRVVQDYVNSPRLMHHRVKLRPFAVIVAVLAGGEMGGIIGVFLSIPVAATLQILWRRWRSSSYAYAKRGSAALDLPDRDRRVA